MTDFNKRILNEIAHLRYLESIGVKSDRITHSLEILRLVRNTELSLTYEEGKAEEDVYIKTSYNENKYGKIS